MGLSIKLDTKRSTVGPALCGAVLVWLAVMVHEVHRVVFGRYLNSDPFTYVLVEVGLFGSGGAIAFAAAVHVWSRFVRPEYP
jgi:hypothetical protein